MWPESGEQAKPLRTGLTTGCCATACAVAAARYIFYQQLPQRVSVKLPRGKVVQLTMTECYSLAPSRAIATTVKDAGDDPDITHGAYISTAIQLIDEPRVVFKAGDGVGTVTRDGLALAVGEPAINPVPRQMIASHFTDIAEEACYSGGFEVIVSVANGLALSEKTMNPRLGIIGGLSILGTTGIVRPFSCAAYIASIHQGIDVAAANGFEHIAASTGNRSEQWVADYYQLPAMALIEMGDFVGAVLKYIKKAPVKKLSLCGGFGKISKLANGHLDLHSKASGIDFVHLAALASEHGASHALQEKIHNANTSIEALNLCRAAHIDLATTVCEKAYQKARRYVPNHTALEIFAIDRQGQLVGVAGEGA